MTLEQLKALLDAAAAELAKNPSDEALKTKHAEAKQAYDTALAADKNAGDKGDKGGDGGFDISKLDPVAQKVIKDLRSENATARTKNRELGESHSKLKKALVEAGIIEDDSQEPEEKIKTLSAATDQLSVRNAILEAAVEHGIGRDGLDYFTFLVEKRASQLEDGEELSEADVEALAKEARGKTGGSTGTTSVGAGGKNGSAPPPGESGAVTLESFLKMSITEKSALYNKDKPSYDRLFAEAKATKRLA